MKGLDAYIASVDAEQSSDLAERFDLIQRDLALLYRQQTKLEVDMAAEQRRHAKPSRRA